MSSSWPGFISSSCTNYYIVQIKIGPMHWVPVGSPQESIKDAIKERDYLMKLDVFNGQLFSIWKMEQSIKVSRCGLARYGEDTYAWDENDNNVVPEIRAEQ